MNADVCRLKAAEYRRLADRHRCLAEDDNPDAAYWQRVVADCESEAAFYEGMLYEPVLGRWPVDVRWQIGLYEE